MSDERKGLSEFEADDEVLKEAVCVAQSYCEAEPVSSRICDSQGMFSRTAIITLSDNTEVVVQLRDNEIDATKTALANALLGDVVPVVHGAITTARFAYVSRFLPGIVWADKKMSIKASTKIAHQVGSLIGRCSMREDSAGIVDRYVVPRLRKIISKSPMPPALRTRIETLIPLAEGLKSLPLSLCHIDINEMNIILDGDANIVGLIDWEQAQLLPVGMNAWCIRYLAVNNKHRVDYLSPKTKPMAEAFWKGLIANLPEDLLGFKDKLVDSMMIGLVIVAVFIEGFVPDDVSLSIMIERLDWFESTFRPMCSK